jgi:hypothetical protein
MRNHNSDNSLLQSTSEAQREKAQSIAQLNAELAWFSKYKKFVAFMQAYSQENPITPGIPEETEAVRK